MNTSNNAILSEVNNEREIFFSKNPNPMWIYNPETLEIIEVNESAANLYGYTQQQMSTLTLEDLRPEKEITQMVEFIREKEQTYNDSGVWRHKKNNGESLYVHLFTYPLELDKKTYTLVVAQDVTRQNYLEHQLEIKHELFQLTIDNFPGIYFMLDQHKKLVRWNEQVEICTDHSADELRNKPLTDIFLPDQQEELDTALNRALNKGQSELDGQIKSQTTTPLHLHLLVNRILIDDNPHLVGMGTDITPLKRAMRKLETRSRAIENAMDAIAFVDNNGIITDINKAKSELYSYQSKEELIGEHWSILYTQRDAVKIRREALEGLEHANQWKGKVKGKKADGSFFDMELSVINLEDKGFVAICKNITEQKKHERQIKQSLKEKEVMLTEIHHRVKNNLAVVSSMLQLQAFEEENDEVRIKLLDSVLRIKSMATIHEQLYQAQSFSDIDFSEHIKKLVTNILDAHQPAIPIELVFQLDSIILDVNQAVPCSLIINEAVTNSLKHAFKDNEWGTITFELSVDDNRVKLVIKDNGKGLAEDFDSINQHSLGQTLIHVLAQQLDAKHQYTSNTEGTSFTLEFNKPANNDR